MLVGCFWEGFKDVISLEITRVNIFLGFNLGLVFIYEIHCSVGNTISPQNYYIHIKLKLITYKEHNLKSNFPIVKLC